MIYNCSKQKNAHRNKIREKRDENEQQQRKK